MDQRAFLKVKLKSLAAEARVINDEVDQIDIKIWRLQRTPNLKNQPEKIKEWEQIKEQLIKHRRNVVRIEARHTALAYGFFNGWTYAEIEKQSRTSPVWLKVHKIVKKYMSTDKITTDIEYSFGCWVVAAKVHLRKIEKERKCES